MYDTIFVVVCASSFVQFLYLFSIPQILPCWMSTVVNKYQMGKKRESANNRLCVVIGHRKVPRPLQV